MLEQQGTQKTFFTQVNRGRMAKSATRMADYERHKELTATRQREQSKLGRDIAPLPAVVNRKRRNAALKSLRRFFESYFPGSFPLPWSDDHLKAIAKLEAAIVHGGLFAFAMPRGFGKSTKCERAGLWALFRGLLPKQRVKHEFVVIIGPTGDHAGRMLESIKLELETNDLLHEDFPEVCYPIRRLEGIYQRTGGQLFKGRPTRIDLTAKEIVLPTIPKSGASGGVIGTRGLDAAIRGMKQQKADGTIIRPSLAIIDDPQTEESARSPQQVANRLATLNGAVLNLAGPGKKLAAAMPCTVIHQNDLADQILNPELYPEWAGERMSLVNDWPQRMDLWEQYVELRRDSFRSGGRGEPATEFYAANRADMDGGVSVSWDHFYPHDCLSTIQHAMNLRFRDEKSERMFMAEYQNKPLPPAEAELAGSWDVVTADHLSGMDRGRVPDNVNTLTAFVDVQGSLLYWLVCGWEAGFTGHVLDYGAFPDQQSTYFTLADAKRTLQTTFPGKGQEAAILAGLNALTERILGRDWQRDDGAAMRVRRCLVDANWGESTEVVYRFCRQSAFAGSLLPSHGKYFGAASVPMSDYQRKPGDQIGSYWRIPGRVGTRSVRHVVFDANHWKTFTMARLRIGLGDRSALSFYGRDAGAHQMLRDHMLAEFPVKVSGRGRELCEWKAHPARRDNHFWDCLVGCYVAASMEGVSIDEIAASRVRRAPEGPRLTMQEMRDRARKAREKLAATS
jgi:hypothetical protein